MLQLTLGLLLFLGMHSVSILAMPLRDSLAAKSDLGWKLIYGLVSIAGVILIANGYAEARLSPIILYVAPAWLLPRCSAASAACVCALFCAVLSGPYQYRRQASAAGCGETLGGLTFAG